MAGESAIKAFLNRKNKKERNTESLNEDLYLFDNKIAEWRGDDIWITNAGWKSVTTKDRLNQLPVYVKQQKGLWYIMLPHEQVWKEWNGQWIKITK